MTSEQKVKRALAQLDSAVQEWYAEHAPSREDRYASATIMDGVEDKWHASRITLNNDKGDFVEIKSSKQGFKHD